MGIRTLGLLKMLGAAAVYVVVFTFVLKDGLGDPSRGGPFKLILIAIPGAFGLVGLIEFAIGVEFTKVAGAWDALAGWQRGVLGTLIVIAAFVLMMVGVVLFA